MIVHFCKNCRRCIKRVAGEWKHSSKWADLECKKPEPGIDKEMA